MFAGELLIISLLSAGLALWLVPEPHSDWGYYWAAAGNVERYERGGLSLWLFALPKALDWPPVVSALLLNLLFAVLMLWTAYRHDSSRSRWFALLVAAYLLFITPYFGIVQLDLMAATQVAIGLSLVLASPFGWSKSISLTLATLMIVMGVSTKPQYALVIWAMIGLIVPVWWLLRRRTHALIPVLLGVLLVASIGGFVVDSGMRALSGRSEAIRTNSAVTLYGGLLVSHDRQGCGYWSKEAGAAAKKDLHKTLYRAVLDRLAAKPVSHWVSVMRCKWPEILRPVPYALYWLVESPNIRARIDADPQRDRIQAVYLQALRWERKFYDLLTLVILLTVALVWVRLWRRGEPVLGLLAAAWVVSFWIVHLVFEIQGRYFLGLFLIAPVICALAARLVRPMPP